VLAVLAIMMQLDLLPTEQTRLLLATHLTVAVAVQALTGQIKLGFLALVVLVLVVADLETKLVLLELPDKVTLVEAAWQVTTTVRVVVVVLEQSVVMVIMGLLVAVATG
tara:strand:+ start:54 stop:380 length:327 start_codon:yes stop_codon:yes gene_type:complete